MFWLLLATGRAKGVQQCNVFAISSGASMWCYRSLFSAPRGTRPVAYVYSHIRGVRCFFSSSGKLPNGPLARYEDLVSRGALRPDDRQRAVLFSLNSLYAKIADEGDSFDKGGLELGPSDSTKPSSGGLFSKLFSGFGSKPQSEGQIRLNDAGIYMFGGVGCGKTMLMELFYESLDVQRKRRVHFHQFMLEVHDRLHRMKKEADPDNKSMDLVPILAQELLSEARVLCFDEMQVTDIADAMILRRLFDQLWTSGMILVATSNRLPRDLYKNGLNRQLFVPFIDSLEKHLEIIDLQSSRDYRTMQSQEEEDADSAPSSGSVHPSRSTSGGYVQRTDKPQSLFLTKTSSAEALFHELTKSTGISTDSFVVKGRTHTVERCGGPKKGVAAFSFEEVCDRPLGAIDYIAMAERYHTLFLLDIPQLTQKHLTQARRLITLIDELYEYRVKLVCSSPVTMDNIFVPDKGVMSQAHSANVLLDDLQIEKGSKTSKASLFTGEDERFAFARTLSRLREMQTYHYWRQPHGRPVDSIS